jgi:hypothetical protein
MSAAVHGVLSAAATCLGLALTAPARVCRFNITVGPMRVTWGAGDDHGQDDNDDMGGPGSGLVDGGLAPRRG